MSNIATRLEATARMYPKHAELLNDAAVMCRRNAELVAENERLKKIANDKSQAYEFLKRVRENETR